MNLVFPRLKLAAATSPKTFKTLGERNYITFPTQASRAMNSAAISGWLIQDNQIHCSFLIGKARVTPLKSLTVPRLELNAAVLSVIVSEKLRRELDVNIASETFWTDSRVVLGYIANDVKRFPIFVANRVQEIQERSSLKQWRYVDTKFNPADEASRGVRPRELSKSKWITGPDFLWKDEAEWEIPSTEAVVQPLEDDPDIRKLFSC